MGGIVVCKAQKPPIGRHPVVGGGVICGGSGGDGVGQVKKLPAMPSIGTYVARCLCTAATPL